jgi:hypothetical protein
LRDDLFRSCIRQGRLRAVARGFAFGTTLFTGAFATTRTTRAAAGSATTARRGFCLCLFLDRHFGRRAFDYRLRAGTIHDWSNRLRCCDRGRDRRCGSWLFLTVLAAGPFALLVTLFAGFPLVARFALLVARFALFTGLALFTLLPARLLLLDVRLRRFVHGRLLRETIVLAVAIVHVVLILNVAVPILILTAIVVLEPILHLRLCGGNDAVIVFGVLEIVLRHHAIA